ncbi:MAG: HAD family hydrolase [Bacteroidetes bacterium]|nr:HAD family hydrolase [Bacteroidota bacterium]
MSIKYISDLNIDESWTLFLDRDGVINELLPNEYVTKWEKFEFREGALEAIKKLSSLFGKTFIATNQRGIARNLMTEEDLDDIHLKMLKEIESNGGRIEKIYYCPHEISDYCDCRKPLTGLAEQAKYDYPGISFESSVMIGDSASDIQFGKSLNMRTILMTDNDTDADITADFHYSDLRSIIRDLNI